MKRKKVIVYGLGKFFQKNEVFIKENYDVIAYCDMNSAKSKQKRNGILIDEIVDIALDAEYVLVATLNNRKEICDSLVAEGIPWNKIYFLSNDIDIANKRISSYSQFGEDLILISLAKSIYGSLTNVRYFEIGTNSPTSFNNSYLLYLCGARGVLVDPLPWVKYECKYVRGEDQFLEVAICGNSKNTSKKSKFWIYDNNPALSSLYVENVKNLENIFSINGTMSSMEVDLLPINEVLDGLSFIPNIILVDAEGEDKNIVNSIDYERFPIDIIIAELGKENILKFMQQKGYLKIMSNDVNTIFLRQSLFNRYNDMFMEKN